MTTIWRGRVAALAMISALLISGAHAQKALDVSVPVTDNRSLKAKLYLPAQTPAPAVLVLHTFYGVVTGRAESSDHAFARALAKEGFVALVPNYVDAGLKNRPHQPAIIANLVEMAKWLRTRPEVGGKASGVVGFSVGSVHGSRLAGQDPNIKALVGYYGYYNYRTFPPTQKLSLPPGPVDIAPRIAAATLLLHGTADNETAIDQAREFKAALDKAGKRVELVTYSGAHHRFDRGPNDRMKGDKTADGHIYRLDAKARDDAWKRTLAFLRQHLQ